MATLPQLPPEALEKLSFVLSSGQREKVLGAVMPGSRTPAQLAKETGLHLPHVSRALSQLARQGLVAPLANGNKGKLYGPTPLGKVVFDEVTSTRGDRLVAPLARGSHFHNYHHWLAKKHGRRAADEFFTFHGINPKSIDPNGWYPLRTVVSVLDAIEATFGDGTGQTVRVMLRDETMNFASVKRYFSMVIPFRYFLEMAPAMYAREFNHGRLEMETHGRRALVKNYDWISSPARCAAWLGVYEGSMLSYGFKHGTVRKVACILKGDPYCGYEFEW
ncbi:MAG TPA: winged helix-turn-helix domain-containing protein [Thermoplasmata archaeon]|nr:winged helix-turn-helix domain-containing protein [Thermoplasmata archaeon]